MNVPLYQQITDELKESILSKKIRAGEQLPTEKELSDTYHVSRITAKRALTELEQLGMVTRTRGKGTFVKTTSSFSHHSSVKRILFVIPFEGLSFGDFTQGLVPVLQEDEATVLITYTDYLRENSAATIRENFEGLIYYPMDTGEYLDVLLELSLQDFPVILLDKQIYDLNFPCVTSDNLNGGEQAAQALIELGHKRIAFIMSNDEHHPHTTRNRYLGYVKALKEHGISFHTTFDSPAFTEKHLLDLVKKEHITGLIFENDLIALEGLRHLQGNGYDIPNDLSIIGFDNILAASLSNPPLTTVAQDFSGIGKKAGELILDWLKTGDVPESCKIPVQLIERSTTKALIDKTDQ